MIAFLVNPHRGAVMARYFIEARYGVKVQPGGLGKLSNGEPFRIVTLEDQLRGMELSRFYVIDEVDIGLQELAWTRIIHRVETVII